MNIFKRIKQHYKSTNKETFWIYVILRLCIIICAILQLLYKNYSNFFICLLSLILFTIPYLISHKLSITLPSGLEIVIFCFIFCSIILGEIQNFYSLFKYWDTMLHTINGFLCAAIGFSLIDILNKTDHLHINMSSCFITIVVISFSMTIGIFWEFFEYGADTFLKADMQKDTIVTTISSTLLEENGKNKAIVIDNIKKVIIINEQEGKEKETVIEGGYLDIGIKDTMADLFVNLVGAIVFSIICTLYMKGKDKYCLTEKFIPQVKKS